MLQVDCANEAASKIADYFNAPPSVIPAIEQIILRTLPPSGEIAIADKAWAKTAAAKLNKEGWLLADASPEEIDEVAAIIATSNPPLTSCGRLRQVASMALQQLEFQYGKRQRGWDAQFLMEQISAAIAEFDTQILTEQTPKEQEQ